MNGELPPIDPQICEQLARRSAGRLPDGLMADVAAALETVSADRPRRMRLSMQPTWRSPRMAVAAGLALVVVMGAVLLAFPRLASGPAANSQSAALTATELASLLAGPPLATNTTLVAKVTVDAKNDVCPMDRYPTLGVVEGMGSQVCVMGADTIVFLSSDGTSPAKVTGTFAFRYLAPGYLGLLGELTLPSTGLTFGATDDWPLQGKTFLVDGWLGADELTESCAWTPTSGDVLTPNGNDCPYDDWLGASSTAPGIAADDLSGAASAASTYDPLSLRGDARHVEAGGMRLIDSIDPAAPVHGVYVVRSATGACPDAPPQSSIGCGFWLVLARVADESLHAPAATATPSPTPTPGGEYPTNRALTTEELGRVLAQQLPVDTTVVASVTIDAQRDACPLNGRPTVGVVHGFDPQLCVVGPLATAGVAGPTGPGIYAFRYLAPGYLGLLGKIAPASSSRLAYSVANTWPGGGSSFLVRGWLGADPMACPTNIATDGGDPLNPDGPDQCAVDWMSDEDPNAKPSSSAGSFPPVPERLVEAGGMRLIDDLPSNAVFGVYVVRGGGTAEACTTSPMNGPGCGLVLAKVADLSVPGPSLAPSSAVPTPTAAPPATPATPLATPTSPIASAATGLLGSGNRPLTEGEFATLWAADPAYLVGRIAIVKGPVPEDLGCSKQSVTPNGAACGTIAPEGYWAVSVGSGGKVSVLGALATPTSGFVWTVDGAKAGSGPQAGQIIAVDALLEYWFNFCDIQRLGGCSQSWLVRPDDNILSSIEVQEAAYTTFGSTPAGNPAKIRGVYLLRVGLGNTPWTLLSRLEPATLP